MPERSRNVGKVCWAAGCGRDAKIKGLCNTCYVRAKSNGGDPDVRVRGAASVDSIETRLWRRTRKVPGPLGECWVFTGAATGKGGAEGYRGLRWHGKWKSAHRWAYLLLVDPEVGSLDVHHRCGTKGCWRPEHLEALTRLEHRRRHAAPRLRGPMRLRPVATAVLAVLVTGSRSGPELIAATGSNRGTLYAILRRFEGAGLIRTEDTSAPRRFVLTPAGQLLATADPEDQRL